MSPDLHELIGEEGDERLRRVHDALVAAGPAPELPLGLASAPAPPARVIPLRRRRFETALAAAAAAVAVAFGVGYLVGNQGTGFQSRFPVTMHGIGEAKSASAKIEIGGLDAQGNWPLLFTVHGLKAAPKGGWYELYLTQRGKLVASCGPFNAGQGKTVVHMNVPFHLNEYDGWVVIAHVPGQKHVPVLLTT